MKRASRILLQLIAVLLLMQSCLAQSVIKGKVYAAGAPLVDAVVRIPNTEFGAYTDDSGAFSITNIPEGKHPLEVSATGFTTQKQMVHIKTGASVTLNFNMEPAISDLDEVTVTGVSRATLLRKNPVPISVLSLSAMRKQINGNIMDAVTKGVPGVSGVSTGPNITKPFIRGLGYNRVLTLYDGVRQEGQQWGDEHGIEADQYAIERIEIVKGPASLVYGSDAVAGVINMMPAVPPANLKRLKGSFTTEYQTNNGMAAVALGLQYRNKQWYWIANFAGKTAHDYQNRVDGYVYNTGYQELNGSGILGYKGKWAETRLGLTYYDNKQEIPDGTRDSLSRAFTMQVNEGANDDVKLRPPVPNFQLTNYSVAALHQHIQHQRLYNHTTIVVPGGDLQLVLGIQQNVRQEFTHPTATTQPGLAVRLRTLNYEASYNVQLHNNLDASVGINGMYQQNNNRNATDFPLPNHHLFDGGSYLLAKWGKGKLNISGGLRYDTRRTGWSNLYTLIDTTTGFGRAARGADTNIGKLQFPAFEATYTGLSGSLGATLLLGKGWLAKANIARGYRAPNTTEIGSNGLDPGAHIVYLGNRSFQPEFSLQQDIGISAKGGAFTANLELFRNAIDGYIYQARAFDAQGKPIIVVPGNVTYQYNQSAAVLFGGEFNGSYQPTWARWLSISGVASYVEGRNKNPQLEATYGNAARYLPLIPPLHLGISAEALLRSPLKRVKEVTVQLAADRFATQEKVYAVENSETKTAGYTLVKAGISATITNRQQKDWCYVSLLADNLLDVAYQSHLNRLKYFEYFTSSPSGRYGIYNMGRNIALRITVPFGGQR